MTTESNSKLPVFLSCFPPSPQNSWCVTGSTISHFFPKALQLLLLNPSFLLPCCSKQHPNIGIENLASVHLSPVNIHTQAFLLTSERDKGVGTFLFCAGGTITWSWSTSPLRPLTEQEVHLLPLHCLP